MSVLVLSIMPGVFAVDIGSRRGINIITEDFPPIVWQCDHRIVYDDGTEPGRITPGFCSDPAYDNEKDCTANYICIAPYYTTEETCTAGGAVWVDGRCTVPAFTTEEVCLYYGNDWIPNTWTVTNELVERLNNYAFEGEQIQWKVLVMDKNGIEKVGDVYVTVGQGNSDGGNTKTITKEEKLTYCGNIPSTSTDWQKSITLPKYNPSLGNLTGVKLEFQAGLSSDIKIEHLGTETPAEFIATVDGNVSLNFSDVYLQTNIVFNQNGTATIYDGVTDFAGTSGKTFPTISGSNSLTKNSSHLNDFVRTFPGENFNVSVKANSVFQVNGPGNYATSVLTNANATACVTYTYETEEVITIPGDGEIEANCALDRESTREEAIDPTCNARIDEEELTEFNPETMAYYTCTLTVETPESMYGPADINVEVTDLDGLIGKMVETENWFLNPMIELFVSDDITFNPVRPGTSSYTTNKVLIGNEADEGSGVMLDMFISGTDFYDSSSSGAKCGESNVLRLENFRYYATNGAYSTHDDDRSDAEGYAPIEYGIGFNDPHPFYNNNEIIQAQKVGPYWTANLLAPGAEMSLKFRLDLPEPCNGDFDTGSIYFWGEAV
jgi:hypothetical protein